MGGFSVGLTGFGSCGPLAPRWGDRGAEQESGSRTGRPTSCVSVTPPCLTCAWSELGPARTELRAGASPWRTRRSRRNDAQSTDGLAIDLHGKPLPLTVSLDGHAQHRARLDRAAHRSARRVGGPLPRCRGCQCDRDPAAAARNPITQEGSPWPSPGGTTSW